MSTTNHIPRTVDASLEARLAPFRLSEPRTSPEAVAPRQERSLKLSLMNDLKLMFAALGAGGSVVPLGDNHRAARLLAEYAAALRQH